MRLHILSDLPLELGPFTPPEVEADAVILAGDIHTGRNGLKWASKTFPDRPVIYVLGNHEFYGHIHYSCHYTLGQTRVLVNPRGYPTELQTDFNPALTVEV